MRSRFTSSYANNMHYQKWGVVGTHFDVGKSIFAGEWWENDGNLDLTAFCWLTLASAHSASCISPFLSEPGFKSTFLHPTHLHIFEHGIFAFGVDSLLLKRIQSTNKWWSKYLKGECTCNPICYKKLWQYQTGNSNTINQVWWSGVLKTSPYCKGNLLSQ